MRMSDSIKEIAAAFAKFQAEVNNPKNTAKNPQFGSKYAPLDVVINEIKSKLASQGLSFLQSTGSEGENVVIKTLITHESGEWIESEPLILPAYQVGKGGSKNYTAQGCGSAITYGRRYSLTAMLGISSEDDDDGNHVSERQDNGNENGGQQRKNTSGVASEKQMKMIHAKIASVATAAQEDKETVTEGLKKQLGIQSLSDISSQMASQAITILKGWEQKYGGGK
ncbi:ERF family protein [Bacillus cereus]|uniref:ERF family protein n=3 Tax=Bacillus cereus TaxID=1396 RepID=A0A9X7GTK8_BACCE|nr:ERF family protein [Bacillus cereus]PGS69052.1 ERF family protein [Bacillus cereus]